MKLMEKIIGKSKIYVENIRKFFSSVWETVTNKRKRQVDDELLVVWYTLSIVSLLYCKNKCIDFINFISINVYPTR